MPIKPKCDVCDFETEDLRPWGKDPNKKNICPRCGLHPDQIETTLSYLMKEETGEDRMPSAIEINVFRKNLILKMVQKLSQEIKK
jgi:predicted amidophosphoribosyltransferase